MESVNCSNESVGDEAYYLAISPPVITATKVLVTVSSFLSTLGASWIIITYLAFKDLRTTARSLLVNLSIADLLIASSHFVGVIGNYERFMPYYNGTSKNDSVLDPLCVSQAAVTMFGTMSLFFWTMAIAIYMLALTLSGNQKMLRVLVVVMYVVCWGVPVPFVIASAAQQVLGSYTASQGMGVLTENYASLAPQVL